MINMYVSLPVYIPDEIVDKVEEMAEGINLHLSPYACLRPSLVENYREQYIRLLAKGDLEGAAKAKAYINFVESQEESSKRRHLESQRRAEEEAERERQRIREAREAREAVKSLEREEYERQRIAGIPWRPH